MTVHLNTKDITGVELLQRWQNEMKHFGVHARSHLVHYLRCVKLESTANRYSNIRLLSNY